MEGSYGILSVLPLLVMLGLVIWTKRIFESILVAIGFALIIQYGFSIDVIYAFEEKLYGMLASETYPWILIILILFGALINLLIESGGTLGFAKYAERVIKSEKSSLIVTWILGILIFVDDYLNNLTIGAAMRGITDQHKVPREMTAMAINVTGAPVCVLLPFSTWAAFIYGLMLEVGVAEGGLISEYTKLIPFIFFAIVMVGMVPFMALGIIPRFGPIKKAYERVEKTGKTFPEDLADTMGIEFAETQARIKEKGEPKLYDFLIPIIAVIVLVITTEEIMYGLFLALALCFILYVPRKKMNIREFFDNFFEGAKEMLFIAIFVMMAFIFVEAVEELGLSEYVITSVEPYLNGALLPALAFVIVAVLAFFGIDFWGIMILMFPIVAPLAQASGVNVYLSLGGVVSGAVFGGMACFFSEQMIMSSTSVQIRPTDQAVCLLPYALIACAATTILYLIFGFAL